MWTEAKLLWRVIKAPMLHWWRKVGIWWLAVIFAALALSDYLIWLWMPRWEPDYLQTIASTLRHVSNCLLFWLAYRVMQMTLACLSTEVRSPQSGWIQMRSMFLLLQMQLLPLVGLYSSLYWLSMLLPNFLLTTPQRGLQISRLASLFGNLVNESAGIVMAMLWLSVLLGMRPGQLPVVRCLVLARFASIAIVTPVLIARLGLPYTVPFNIHSWGTLAGLLSLTCILTWLGLVRIGRVRAADIAGKAMIAVQVLIPVLSMTLLYFPESQTGHLTATLLRSTQLLMYSLPSDGGQIGEWLRHYFPATNSVLGLLAAYASRVYSYLWLTAAYAICWGILLRPDKAQRENQFAAATAAPVRSPSARPDLRPAARG